MFLRSQRYRFTVVDLPSSSELSDLDSRQLFTKRPNGNENNMTVRDLVDYVAEAMELEKMTNEKTYEAVKESSIVEKDASELQV